MWHRISDVGGFAQTTVSPVSLPAVPGSHDGTGAHQATILAVRPSSVSGPAALEFDSADVSTTTMLFALASPVPVVPNWFGVAIPAGASSFTKPNIFFHPVPALAGYQDLDYAAKSGKWPQLFSHVQRLGYQVDAAIHKYGANAGQIVIMPFLTSAGTDTGILPAEWFGIVTEILTQVRAAMGMGSDPLAISEVAVSSFGTGYVYSAAFRESAKGLQALLRHVWDFDGYPKSLSSILASTPSVKAIKYDQLAEPGSIHLPFPRWSQYPNPPPAYAPPAPRNSVDVHYLIRDFMFLHAATEW